LKFFLAREVPRHCVEFVVRACGGEIAHDENDADITHYVIDKVIDFKIKTNKKNRQKLFLKMSTIS